VIATLLVLAAAVAPPPADSSAVAAPFTLVESATIASRDSVRSGVDQPAGVALDAFGRLYVTDLAQHRLQQFSADGTPLWETGTLGSGDGGMRRPSSVTPVGTLFVAVLDVENRRVLAFDLFGRAKGVLIDLSALESDEAFGRIDPVGIAADRGGALYLADAERDRVLAFDFAGRPTGAIGGYGTRTGSMRGVRGLAVTPRGEIVVAERGNARVQRLTSAGRGLASWPLPVRAGRGALAVAADDSGRVAVADEAAGRLWVFDRAGTMLARLDGLDGPRGIAFEGERGLIVSEARAGRVRRFTLTPVPPPTPER
jgi:tripartite motif-containing protein 71